VASLLAVALVASWASGPRRDRPDGAGLVQTLAAEAQPGDVVAAADQAGLPRYHAYDGVSLPDWLPATSPAVGTFPAADRRWWVEEVGDLEDAVDPSAWAAALGGHQRAWVLSEARFGGRNDAVDGGAALLGWTLCSTRTSTTLELRLWAPTCPAGGG
jgi:hypothetical protein